jgi:hypothetical protein
MAIEIPDDQGFLVIGYLCRLLRASAISQITPSFCFEVISRG